MDSLARDLEDRGQSCIKLNIGETDFSTPHFIVEAAYQSMKDGNTFYPPIQGFPDLLQAIVDKKIPKEHRNDYAINNIMIHNGAKQALFNTMLCLLEKGDEAIILSPCWVTYPDQVRLTGAKAVLVNGTISNNFIPPIELVKKHINERTKMIIFSSPSNPTGVIFDKPYLQSLVDIVADNPNIYLVSDEIYEHLNFVGTHETLLQFTSVKDRLIVINGFSKSFAMTGWRIGYMIAPLDIIESCKKIQSQTTSGVCNMAQKGAIAALKEGDTFIHKIKTIFRERRDFILEKLSTIEGIRLVKPEGAFYVFPDMSHFFGKHRCEILINNGDDMAMYLLKNAHVCVVGGVAFGEPNCIRLSFANSKENIDIAIDSIKESLNKLQ